MRPNNPRPNSRTTPVDGPGSGGYQAKYIAFLEVMADTRPRLHRYCTRMVGSALDGEDVVQEALFHAYRSLDSYDDSRPLAPWLFRIAHNACLDHLRRQRVRTEALQLAGADEAAPGSDPTDAAAVPEALEHLVLRLPAKERACVLLKDVLDYSLADTAEIVDSTVGGVKAALHRARSKLATSKPVAPRARAMTDEQALVMRLYVDRFNDRDWDGVLELTRADARLEVVDRYAGSLADSPYFTRIGGAPVEWKMVLGTVDGESVVIRLHRADDAWTPYSAARVRVEDGVITHITDYVHCTWVLEGARAIDAPIT